METFINNLTETLLSSKYGKYVVAEYDAYKTEIN